MASSFASQIPHIINIVCWLKPAKILDIGKGFGKYGFLLHEYAGVNTQARVDPAKMLKEQSQIDIDCVEIDDDLLLPHLTHFYNNIFKGSIIEVLEDLPAYDLVIMIDIIEHLTKDEGKKVVEHFLRSNTTVLIATPLEFFEQHLFESIYEEHKSHWSKEDFRQFNAQLTYMNSDGAGGLYLLSTNKIEIPGFGRSLANRCKRIVRAIRNEL